MQVHKNLQLRIEAQGKYLQTILEKAKETLAGHTSASPDLKAAHAELTELASKVIGDPGTFAASTSQQLAGLNPPELTNLASNLIQEAYNEVHNVATPTLTRQQSGRTSDTSSQKSHLTAIQEDSGGISGGCEQPSIPGNKIYSPSSAFKQLLVRAPGWWPLKFLSVATLARWRTADVVDTCLLWEWK